MKKLLWTTMFFCACGDELVGNDYLGDPIATVQGDLEIEGARPNEGLQVDLIWHVTAAVDYKLNQSVSLEGPSVGRYRIDLLVPPPDAALNTDPETGGKIGFANIFAYDDPRNEGPIDLSKIAPKDYPTLLYRFRGGASNVMVAYAKDAFPAGSRIATALGRAIEPGFFLVRFDGDCICPISPDPCHDSAGKNCSRNTLVPLPVETEVPVTLVDQIEDFAVVHAPDWLFL